MEERNYKVVKIQDKFYVELETYCIKTNKYRKGIFKDYNGDNLEFMRDIDAHYWIRARYAIIKAFNSIH